MADDGKCRFSIGEPNQQDPKVRGECKMQEPEGAVKGEDGVTGIQTEEGELPDILKLKTDEDPGTENLLKIVKDFDAGKNEPNAQVKWSDGANFVWFMT